MEFSKSHARFRNWTLGQSEGAGEAYTDTGRALTGEIGADASMLHWLRKNVSGAFAILNTPKTGSGDVQSTYEGNYSVNFDAARVWGAAHSGVEFAPVHIYLPIILYLGRPA